MSERIDVLAVMDRARDVLAEIYAKHQRAIGPFATQAQKSNGSLREARAAVAELVAAAREVADEHMGLAATTKYYGEDDEVGERACCGVVSYESHTADCPAVRLRAALARVGGAP